jgi:GntR family transcriptional regulator
MTEPLYRVIAEDLRQKIETGKLAPGTQLMTEVELREEYGPEGKASRSTIRDAIKLLVARGLVETRPGQGTFVVKKVRAFVSKLTTDPEAGGVEDEVYKSEVERRGRIPEVTRPRVEVQLASDLVARRLALPAGTQVVSRHQRRSIDGTPWSMQTTFYPLAQVERGANSLLMAENLEGGAVAYLNERLKIKQAGWRDTITARPPTAEERTFFGLSDKVLVAIFEFRRTSFDQQGIPIRFTVTVYPADRNQFEMEAGEIPHPSEPPASESPAKDQDRVSNHSR